MVLLGLRGCGSRWRQWGVSVVELVIVVSMLVVLITMFVPTFVRNRSMDGVAECEKRQRKVAEAVKAYAEDHKGTYPRSLEELTVGETPYLKEIPVCPVTEKDSYSQTYMSFTDPDAFTFFCGGENHVGAGLSPNCPGVSNHNGLYEYDSMLDVPSK